MAEADLDGILVSGGIRRGQPTDFVWRSGAVDTSHFRLFLWIEDLKSSRVASRGFALSLYVPIIEIYDIKDRLFSSKL